MRTRPPAVVLAASLALTLLATSVVAVTGAARDEARFLNAVVSTGARIQARLATYETMLHGANALFAASRQVTDEEFRAFVASFDVVGRYPGIQGLGFAAQLTPTAVDSLVQARRAAGDHDFHVRPDTARPIWSAIVHLEPRDGTNQAAIGFDMYSQPTRRAAMAAARDSGRAVLSGRVRLVQEAEGAERRSFLLYDPVYVGSPPGASVAERRTKFLGWVYAPFKANDLFAGIFGDAPPPVAFRVYDGAGVDPERLLYDSQADPRTGEVAPARDAVFEHVDTIPLYDHRWTIAYASLPIIEERAGRLLAPGIAITGALVSLLIFGLTRAEVRARTRAEQIERARARFYAAMSHELRTPLNAIMGYNDLILAEVYGPLSAQQQQGIERSQRAAHHLLDVINDVLDLSKIEAGKMELDLGPVHVPALVSDLFTTVGPIAADRGTTLRQSCEPGLGPIHSDARRVRQILLNLLSNAIKFGEGRPVEVRCRGAAGGGVTIEVVDQGLGIAPADQERIFEEFVQLDASQGVGTGLGLPISRRLARLLGGTLEVESRKGAGSTFRVTLPGGEG